MVMVWGCSSRRSWAGMTPAWRSATRRCCQSNAAPYSMQPGSRHSHLSIDGQTVDGVETFAHHFGKGGVRMDGVHDGLHRGFRFHGSYRFGDQFESIRADDMHTQNFAEFLVGHHLDESAVAVEDAGAAIAGERKLADLHLVALRAGLRFRQPHAADARLGVGAAGDTVAIDGCG